MIDIQTALPLFIFLLTQILALVVYLWQRNKKLKEKEFYYLSLLELAQDPIKRQTDIFKNICNKLSENSDDNIILPHTSHVHLKMLSDFPNEEVFYLFVRRKKGHLENKIRIFNWLMRNIDVSINVIDHHPKEYHKYHDILNTHIIAFTEHVEKLADISDSIITQNIEYGTFISDFQDNINITLRQPPYSRKKIYEILITPLIQNSQSHLHYPLAAQITNHAVVAHQAYQSMILVRKHYCEIFTSYISTLETAKSHFSKYRTELLQLKTRLIFKTIGR